MPEDKNNLNKKGNDYARYTGLAFEMMAVIGGLTWLGVWLDTKTGSEIPWFTITLAPGSVILSIIIIIKDLTRKK